MVAKCLPKEPVPHEEVGPSTTDTYKVGPHGPVGQEFEPGDKPSAGGVVATPTAQERSYAQEQHFNATAMQRQHFQQAANNPDLLAKNNGGHPAIAATPHPGAFNAPGVVGAHGAAAPPPHAAPAVANTNGNRGFGNGNANGNKPFGGPGQANGANAPHPQSANGKAPAQKQKAAKPHPNKENGRREPQTALR